MRTYIPYISMQQMVEVDRLMIEEYGIQLIQIMKNVGKNLAELNRRLNGGSVAGMRIAILCGTGNSGGGGMVAARHLHNWGAQIELVLFLPAEKMKDVLAQQVRILERMGVTPVENSDLSSMALVIDAMMGNGLSGNPRRRLGDWIRRVNDAHIPVLALDAPTGLDATIGIPTNPCVRAAATMTLALPKIGFRSSKVKPFIGDLYLADIGVPPGLYAIPSLGLEVGQLFNHDTIIHLES